MTIKMNFMGCINHTFPKYMHGSPSSGEREHGNGYHHDLCGSIGHV